MKGNEFLDQHKVSPHSSSSMFTKIQLPHHHLHAPPPRAAFPHAPPPISPETKNEPIAPPPSAGGNDGATIELIRRRRGRPPGSKNKPKPPPPPAIDGGDSPPMSPYILELPAGVDLIESVTRFCRVKNTGLCVLSGSGSVSNVTLRQPTVTFHGRYDILSISATISPQNPGFCYNGFTISLGGPNGKVVGGAVVGPLITAGTVYLISATFNNPSYYRFPVEDGGAGDGGGVVSPQTAVSGGGDSVVGPSESVYGCHLPSDGIWTPTARPPPPPPY